MNRNTEDGSKDLAAKIRRSARRIASETGLAGLSAREIARRVGYSAGSLYNVFRNIDEIILHVEAELLDELNRDLELASSVTAAGGGSLSLSGFIDVYLASVRNDELAWSLFVDHALPSGSVLPAWYETALDQVLNTLGNAIAYDTALTEEERRRAAFVLWSSMQGLNSFHVAEKYRQFAPKSPDAMTKCLVNNYVRGLRSSPSNTTQSD